MRGPGPDPEEEEEEQPDPPAPEEEEEEEQPGPEPVIPWPVPGGAYGDICVVLDPAAGVLTFMIHGNSAVPIDGSVRASGKFTYITSQGVVLLVASITPDTIEQFQPSEGVMVLRGWTYPEALVYQQGTWVHLYQLWTNVRTLYIVGESFDVYYKRISLATR